MKLIPRKRLKLLQYIVEYGGNISAAAKRIGVNPSYICALRRRDSEFDAAVQEAIDRGAELLESEAIRRAFTGVEKPVFYQGIQVGHVQEYSDALLRFLLKAKKPAIYGDRTDLNIVSQEDPGHVPAEIAEIIDRIYDAKVTKDLPDQSRQSTGRRVLSKSDKQSLAHTAEQIWEADLENSLEDDLEVDLENDPDENREANVGYDFNF